MLLATCDIDNNLARCLLCDWKSMLSNRRPAEYQILEHLRLIHHRGLISVDQKKGMKYYKGPYYPNDMGR